MRCDPSFSFFSGGGGGGGSRLLFAFDFDIFSSLSPRTESVQLNSSKTQAKQTSPNTRSIDHKFSKYSIYSLLGLYEDDPSSGIILYCQYPVT